MNPFENNSALRELSHITSPAGRVDSVSSYSGCAVYLDDEQWVPAIYHGQEFNSYEVSSRGRVRSLDRIDRVGRHLMGKMLKLCRSFVIHVGGRHYLQVSLYYKNGMPIKASVHRLVLESFVGSCPTGMECCHSNGNPEDNQLTNLRWDTRMNNMQDSIAMGLQAYGSRCPNAKLTSQHARNIKLRYKRYSHDANLSILAKEYGVGVETVRHVVKGRTWHHVVSRV